MSRNLYFEEPDKRFSEAKFVQIYVDSIPILRTSRRDEYCHKDVLKRSLEEIGINDYDFINNSSDLMILPEGSRYGVVGMGRIRRHGDIFVLSGASLDYLLGPNEKHLEDLRKYLSEDIDIRI
jgi:hypothetical protein